ERVDKKSFFQNPSALLNLRPLNGSQVLDDETAANRSDSAMWGGLFKPIELPFLASFPRRKSGDAQTNPSQTNQAQTGATGSPGPITLSFQEAVRLALLNNLNALLARERRREARGRAEQARAGLLPNLSGDAVQQDLTVNLAAEGFPSGLFPGLRSTLIGPFKSFDARVRLVQTIFNLSAIRQFEAGQIDVGIANLQEQLARQQVTTRTAIAYLNVLSS